MLHLYRERNVCLSGNAYGRDVHVSYGASNQAQAD